MENSKEITEPKLSAAEYDDIISSAGLGVWHIIFKEGSAPRMQANAKMAELLGISGLSLSEEEVYNSWFDNVVPEAVPSVRASMQEMMDGQFSENTYLWKHPDKGIIYVRCGGTAKKLADGSNLLSGYHADVTAIVLNQEKQKQALVESKILAEAHSRELSEQFDIINSLAKAYNSMYYVSLNDYSFVQLGVNLAGVKEVIGTKGDGRKSFEEMYKYLVAPEMVEDIKVFTDLTTLKERLKDREWISKQFFGPVGGWAEGIFIVVNRDMMGQAEHVIWATRNIDEFKKKEESLIFKSNTDELTGLLNRRAYEVAITQIDEEPIPEDFVYVSIDINGLKTVNDNIGHAAGDELIVGACECMKRCFGSYGKLFRTGGDEFSALIFATDSQLESIKQDVLDLSENWFKDLVFDLSLSCGYVTRREMKGLSMHEVAVLADKRMYSDKSNYYRKKGVDRRGQRDAHIALCALYTKILKINLTEDSFQVVNINKEEQKKEYGFSDKISEWMREFGKSGMVHPNDLKEYLNKTNMEYMQNYFREGNTSLKIFYRRKYEGEYLRVMMEIIPTDDYSNENQSLYLYVKEINN